MYHLPLKLSLMCLKQWHDGRGNLRGLENLLTVTSTHYLPNIEYHVPHIAMVNDIEDMEQLLDFFSKSEGNGISNSHYEEDLSKACKEPLIEKMVRTFLMFP